jgi:hypothetical protein
MEGHISHVYAALFTSRPKGYTRRMIEKLAQLRTLSINGVDLAKTYLEQNTDYFPSQKAELTLPSERPSQASIESSGYWHREMMRNINHSGYKIIEPS